MKPAKTGTFLAAIFGWFYVSINTNPVTNYKTDINAFGGAIFLWNGTLKLHGGVIRNNFANGGGGGVYISGFANLEMTGGIIEGNIANLHEGGGIFIGTYGPSPVPTTDARITGGIIRNNTTNTENDWGGGGIFVENKRLLKMDNAYISNNGARGFGGGIAGCPHGAVGIRLTDSVMLSGNHASVTAQNINGNNSFVPIPEEQNPKQALFSNYGLGYNKVDSQYWVGDLAALKDKGFDSSKAMDYYALYNSGVQGGESQKPNSVIWKGRIAKLLESDMNSDYPAGNHYFKVEGKDQDVVSGTTILAEHETLGLTYNGKIEKPIDFKGAIVEGNYSNTHGGGIACNGSILFSAFKPEGDKEEIFTSWSIDIQKKLINESNEELDLVGGEFEFELRHGDKIISTATNDEKGNVTFIVSEGYAGNKDGVVYNFTIHEVPSDLDKDSYKYSDDKNIKVKVITTTKKITVGNITVTTTRSEAEIIEEPELPVVIENIKLDPVEVRVTKKWDDASNRDGVRPAYIKLQLFNGDTPYGDPVTVHGTDFEGLDQWEYTFKDLPQYINGERAEYYVHEVSGGYQISESRTVAEDHRNVEIEITNTYNPEYVDIPVYKVWLDNDNAAGNRPEKIQVQLFKKTGEEFEPVSGQIKTLHAGNQWYDVFTNLPRKENGKEIEYSVEEISSDSLEKAGYTSVVQPTGVCGKGFRIVNYKADEKLDIHGKKIWIDNNNQDGARPESISFTLWNHNKYVDTITVKNPGTDEWKFAFYNLPMYVDGIKCDYTVSESFGSNGEHFSTGDYTYEVVYADELKEVEGRTVQEVTVTNTKDPDKTQLTVKKQWTDNNNSDLKRPESVTVGLYRENGSEDGAEVIHKETEEHYVLTLSAENKWTAVFEDLPKFEDGKEIQYFAKEMEVPEEYEVKYPETNDGNVCIIENIRQNELTSVQVNKVWEDKEDAHGLRPASITVKLLADGKEIDSKTLTAASDWKAVFRDLPKFSNGEEIKYEVLEEEVSYYKPSYEKTEEGWTITNTYNPTVVNFPVTKQWKDNCNEAGNRPASITVKLYADGVYTGQSLKLDASNGWKGRFTGLDAMKDGKMITYTVEENAVNGYTTVITGDVVNGFVITNTSIVCEPEKPGNTPEKPGDNNNNNNNGNNNENNNNNNNNITINPGGSNNGGGSNTPGSTDTPELPENRVPDTTIPVDKPNSSLTDTSTTNKVTNDSTTNNVENNTSTTNRTTETTDKVALATNAARTSADSGIMKFIVLLAVSGVCLLLGFMFKIRNTKILKK